jgi:hypothetical protein
MRLLLTAKRGRKQDLAVTDIKQTGCNGVDWIHLVRLKISGSSCESGNETSGSVKTRVFLDEVTSNQLLKKDSATWG